MPAPVELLASRLARLCAAVRQSGADALVVSHPPNLLYLLGVSASAGLAVVAADAVTIIADERYREAFAQAAEPLPTASVVAVGVGSSYEQTLATVLREMGVATVGVEAESMTLSRASAIRRQLQPSGGVVLVETDGTVELLRMVKDPWEQAIFRAAGARLTEVAACILPKVSAGRRERDVASEIEVALRAGGFERPAFDTIVAAGPNGARPHHRAGDRRIEPGDLVVVDFGGVLDGYAVDMTRTVAVGAIGRDERSWLRAVAAAQTAAIAAIKPGVRPSEIDAAARSALHEAGLGEHFVHSTGHGLGLEIHERPTIGPRGDAVGPLVVGMVFTVEPGVYIPGRGGVRIEDDVIVTATGAERLTGAVPGFEAHES
ncbi:MAG: Xaa-Pro peptidase family protein [Acidobacteriota bacterium]